LQEDDVAVVGASDEVVGEDLLAQVEFGVRLLEDVIDAILLPPFQGEVQRLFGRFPLVGMHLQVPEGQMVRIRLAAVALLVQREMVWRVLVVVVAVVVAGWCGSRRCGDIATSWYREGQSFGRCGDGLSIVAVGLVADNALAIIIVVLLKDEIEPQVLQVAQNRVDVVIFITFITVVFFRDVETHRPKKDALDVVDDGVGDHLFILLLVVVVVVLVMVVVLARSRTIVLGKY